MLGGKQQKQAKVNNKNKDPSYLPNKRDAFELYEPLPKKTTVHRSTDKSSAAKKTTPSPLCLAQKRDPVNSKRAFGVLHLLSTVVVRSMRSGGPAVLVIVEIEALAPVD